MIVLFYFIHIGLVQNDRNNEQARVAIRDAEYEIVLGLMPKSIKPLIIAAQEIFCELPVEHVDLKVLSGVTQHSGKCIINRKDHLINKVVE
ncbi:unnamed protein product [Rotaria sp. Silwood2]|nr:unnamed protein product [Rotaria sp. Silwood2]